MSIGKQRNSVPPPHDRRSERGGGFFINNMWHGSQHDRETEDVQRRALPVRAFLRTFTDVAATSSNMDVSYWHLADIGDEP
jgi:hypothetical protein